MINKKTNLKIPQQMKDEDVAIVKIDASNNDVPPTYQVRGFPTLYWAPKDAKSNPIAYEVRNSCLIISPLIKCDYILTN